MDGISLRENDMRDLGYNRCQSQLQSVGLVPNILKPSNHQGQGTHKFGFPPNQTNPTRRDPISSISQYLVLNVI